MQKKMNYSTFLLFKDNVEILNNLRPDLYLSPDINNYKIMGKITEEDGFLESFEEHSKTVRAINTSIILNTTSFLEGFLESILLRKIGSTRTLESLLEIIVNDYKNQIIRISSIPEFKKQFYKLFEEKLENILPSHKDAIKFIEKFYLIRHLLSHGSMISTDIVYKDIGVKLVHTESEYIHLMKLLEKRYSFQENINIEFMSLLLCSKIIDDFSTTVFNIANLLVSELKNKKILDFSDSWGDFSGWENLTKHRSQ